MIHNRKYPLRRKMSYGKGTKSDPCYIKWHFGWDFGRRFTRLLTEKTRRKLAEIYPETKGKDGLSYYQYYVKRDVYFEFPLGWFGNKVVHEFTVKRNFLTDGCSGPGTADATDEANWLLHDWLYATHKHGHNLTRTEADKCMVHRRWFQYLEEAGAVFGVLGLIASEVAVRMTIDQKLKKAWEESGARGSQYISDELAQENEKQLTGK